MVDQSIVTEWISKGEEDYNFARANLEEGKNFFAQICFHFQQAAEKYLKAFIIASDLEFRRVKEAVELYFENGQDKLEYHAIGEAFIGEDVVNA